MYKYIDRNILNILRNKELKLSFIEEFNDPFENLARVVDEFSVNRIKESLFHPLAQKHFYDLFCKENIIDISFNDYIKSLSNKKTVKIYVNKILENEKKRLEKVKQIYCLPQDDVKWNKSQVVFCGSHTPNNVLMWTHYADNHKGVLIDFDYTKLEENWKPIGVDAKRIKYSDKRPQITVGLSKYDIRNDTEFWDIPITKHKAWSYEDEVRFFVDVEKCKKKELLNGKIGYFLSINPIVIKSIIFGLRITEALRADIMIELRKAEWKHVEGYETYIDAETFEIHFKPLPRSADVIK